MKVNTNLKLTEKDKEKAILFLQELIRINSTNPVGNELEVATVIKKYTDQTGIHIDIQPFEEKRGNVLVHLKGKNSKLKPLVFSGHLDTVPVGETPWTYDPHTADIIDGKMYGRGACDMKSGVASMLMSMLLLNESGNLPEADVIFAGTAGEEIGCLGASKLVQAGEINDAGGMVIGEPSNGSVYITHKGALWLKIITHGRTAHGSMPEEGTNAILHMNEVINRLKQSNLFDEMDHKLLGKPTFNISSVQGGVQTNIVPDQCNITIDIRTIPGMKHSEIIRNVHHILEELQKEIEDFQVEVEVMQDLPPLENPTCDFVELAQQINHDLYGATMSDRGVNYFTDGSIFNESLSIPIIIYGPGNEKMAHQTDEYVDVKQYLDSIHFYKEFALNYKG